MTTGAVQAAGLALRRTLSPGMLLLAAAMLALGTHVSRFPAATATDAALFPGAGHLAVQALWSVFLLGTALPLVARAASLQDLLRNGEADLFGALPLGRPVLAASTLAGSLAGAVLLLLVVAPAAWLAGGRSSRDEPVHRRVRVVDHAPLVLVRDGERSVETALDPARLPPGALVRLRPTVAPGRGPAATLRARTRSSTGAAGPPIERRIHGPSVLDLELPGDPPAAPGERLLIDLERRGAGAVVALPAGRIELLAPAGGPWLLQAEILERCACFLLAASSLAALLATHLRPALASLLVLALWTLGWTRGDPTGLVPGGDLPLALGLAGEGLLLPNEGWATGPIWRWGLATGTALLVPATARRASS